MNLVEKIWFGNERLVKVYWLYVVLIGAVFAFVTKSSYSLSNSISLHVSTYLVFVAYMLFVSVGMWRSASKYEGLLLWAVLAKIWVVLNLTITLLACISSFKGAFKLSNSDETAVLVGIIFVAILLFVIFLNYLFLEPKNNTEYITLSNKKNLNSSDTSSYLQALNEYESEHRDKGLWAQCFAEANGDEAIAKAHYLKVRANNIEIGNHKNKKINNEEIKRLETAYNSSYKKEMNRDTETILLVVGAIILFTLAMYFL